MQVRNGGGGGTASGTSGKVGVGGGSGDRPLLQKNHIRIAI